MFPLRRPLHENGLLLALAWCLLLLAAAGGLAVWQQRALLDELERETGVLHRLISQRVGQHDAHLTALSAIATASGERDRGLFLDVAASIIHFYPRIDGIQLVALDAGTPSVGMGALTPAMEAQIRSVASASAGKIGLVPHPRQAHHYLMIKRSPNTAQARYGLMLAIDVEQLVQGAGAYRLKPDVTLRLSLPDGRPLLDRHPESGTVRFARPIGSASQPLVLETGSNIGWADRFPPGPALLLLALVSLAYAAALALWRQRAQARRAAERARINALESRLAHAARVNALGEMASGLTHELTQPLTAILAQA